MTLATLFDATSQPDSGETIDYLRNLRPAFSFTTSASFAAGKLYAYQVHLFDNNPNDGGSVTSTLYADSGDPNNPAPGQLIATLGTIADSYLKPTNTLVTTTIPPNITLAPNTRYWIEGTATSNSQVQEHFVRGDSGTGVSGEYANVYGNTIPNSPGGLTGPQKVVESDGTSFAITAPTSGARVSVIDPTISGTANAGDTVAVGFGMSTQNGAVSFQTALGTTTAASDGTWSIKANFVGDGTYLIVAGDATGGAAALDTITIDSTPNKPLFGTTTTDPNSVGGKVYALYETILGRAPDPVGFENQVAAVNAGASLTTIAQGMISSSEYANDYGSSVSSNAGFVDQLYENGLHRPANDSGAQNWVTALDSGSQTRAQVALAIATSAEASNDLAPTFQAGVFVPNASDSAVARLYYGLLDRAPDAGGLQTQEAALQSGTSINQLAQGFLGSDEYRNTAVGQDNLAYVEGFYQTALGRTGDAAGLQYFQGALDTGALSRAGVADAFLTSSEFQSDQMGQSNSSYINAVYEAALGRQADAGGLATWNAQLAGGASRQSVAQGIVGSAEFATHATAPGQAEFVTALYEGALGRAPAASEVQGWQTALSNGASQASVATGISESPEAMAHLAPKIEAGYHIA